jgi:protoporphyrinogen oxidase
MRRSPETWAVVGGGMLGLVLAHRLTQAGHSVTLYESAPELGGLASAWELGGVTWDRHYHVTLLSDLCFRKVLEEIGVGQDMEWEETRTGCYAGGKHYSVSDTIEFLRFPPLRLIDKFRLGGTIFYASRYRDWKKLEQVLVADWLTRLSGKRTFEKFWLPLLRSKLGENYKVTSAAFIWTTIQRLYAARRTGLKREMFGYVAGGYARILSVFGKRLEEEGVTIRLSSPIKRIASDQGQLEIETSHGHKQSFDKVVVTAPAPVADTLCEGLNEEERRRLRGIRYQGIVCASLLLKKPLTEFYVTNILDEGFPFTGVIGTSTLVDKEKYLDGYDLVYLPRYLPVDHPFFAESDEAVETLFLEHLGRMYPDFRREDVAAFRVSRVRYVCPLSTLHYSENIPNMATSVPGLYLVNSSQILNGTLNVNETVQLAERAARLLTGSSGGESEPE